MAQRLIALAAIALLAGAVAFAVTERGNDESALPEAKGSYVALAAPAGAAALGKRTTCGQVVSATTQGVAHPVLPCGARIYVGFGGKHVLTQVIDRGPTVAGRQFELAPALAELLGVTGVQRVTWSYAAAP